MSKILITGGAGFIARYFVEKFPQDEVLLLDIREPDYSSHAQFVKGDIRNAEDVEKAMKGVDILIHLAAMHHDFGIADEEYFDTNSRGAEIIAQAAEKYGVKQIINFSSVAVYGNQGNPGPTNEEMAPSPLSPYGKSKLEAEGIFSRMAEKTEARLVTIRSTVVFGAWNLANVLNLIKAIDKGLYLHVGKGNNIKSIAYVENIVAAAIFALKLEEKGVCLFNYVDEPAMTSREIAELQAGLLGKKIRISIPLSMAIFLAWPFDLYIKVSGNNLSISSSRVKKFCTQTFHGADKIRRLGFKPVVSIPDGMAKMIRWYTASKKIN
ncbi:MAG: NAD(P)-dependent oxidoreductase [Bacteroidia bacterium]